VERRDFPLRGGPHGGENDALKAGGVVHPWGCSAVLGARPSLGSGLTPDSKLVGCRRCWRCVWVVLQGVGHRGGRRCCSVSG
jgi:hypothetical protein